jgi:N,N-dimethylformamidase
MLIGFVSDENYLALCDVSVEVERDGETLALARSTPRGAVDLDVPAGDYGLVLSKPGYGPKRLEARIAPGEPLQMRLLSERLYGYAWPKWVRSGERAELRVSSSTPYKAELWRYGREKEFVSLLGWFDEHGPRAMTQILPDRDFTITGADWNREGFTTGAYFIPRLNAPERSGLYYVHVSNEAGEFVSFPWVVAPRRPTARVAVLAGTNTWNAYNTFGGRSNYINAEGLPPVPTVNARQDLRRYREGTAASQGSPNDDYPPLSFDRPEPACHVPLEARLRDPMPGRVGSTLAPGLWRLLGWLEEAGWDYDLYGDHQLHTGELDLDAYRTLVLDIHPEYWSREAYERVRDWVNERGGRLIYLGGNGIDCEVEYSGSLAARHLTEHPDESDPQQAQLESRFHRTVEASSALLGVIFSAAGEGTAAPYEIRAADHWVFGGTGLANGERFGEQTLHERVPGGASGHETDKRTPSSPSQTVLLAKGTNANDGGAEMVYYEAARGGGAVFSTGSITYIAALLVDPAVAMITNTVLARFVS